VFSRLFLIFRWFFMREPTIQIEVKYFAFLLHPDFQHEELFILQIKYKLTFCHHHFVGSTHVFFRLK